MIVNAIIQARMGSKRLPGKVMMDLHGEPIIDWTIRNALGAGFIDSVIVAIPTCDLEGPLGNHLATLPVDVVHGSEDDVAGRFKKAVKTYPCHAFVRLCADSPYVPPSLITNLAILYHSCRPPYAHINCGINGSNVEIIDTVVFLKIYPKFTAAEREHVTLYFKRGPDAVVDTQADLDKLRTKLDG